MNVTFGYFRTSFWLLLLYFGGGGIDCLYASNDYRPVLFDLLSMKKDKTKWELITDAKRLVNKKGLWFLDNLSEKEIKCAAQKTNLDLKRCLSQALSLPDNKEKLDKLILIGFLFKEACHRDLSIAFFKNLASNSDSAYEAVTCYVKFVEETMGSCREEKKKKRSCGFRDIVRAVETIQASLDKEYPGYFDLRFDDEDMSKVYLDFVAPYGIWKGAYYKLTFQFSGSIDNEGPDVEVLKGPPVSHRFGEKLCLTQLMPCSEFVYDWKEHHKQCFSYTFDRVHQITYVINFLIDDVYFFNGGFGNDFGGHKLKRIAQRDVKEQQEDIISFFRDIDNHRSMTFSENVPVKFQGFKARDMDVAVQELNEKLSELENNNNDDRVIDIFKLFTGHCVMDKQISVFFSDAKKGEGVVAEEQNDFKLYTPIFFQPQAIMKEIIYDLRDDHGSLEIFKNNVQSHISTEGLNHLKVRNIYGLRDIITNSWDFKRELHDLDNLSSNLNGYNGMLNKKAVHEGQELLEKKETDADGWSVVSRSKKKTIKEQKEKKPKEKGNRGKVFMLAYANPGGDYACDVRLFPSRCEAEFSNRAWEAKLDLPKAGQRAAFYLCDGKQWGSTANCWLPTMRQSMGDHEKFAVVRLMHDFAIESLNMSDDDQSECGRICNLAYKAGTIVFKALMMQVAQEKQWVPSQSFFNLVLNCITLNTFISTLNARKHYGFMRLFIYSVLGSINPSVLNDLAFLPLFWTSAWISVKDEIKNENNLSKLVTKLLINAFSEFLVRSIERIPDLKERYEFARSPDELNDLTTETIIAKTSGTEFSLMANTLFITTTLLLRNDVLAPITEFEIEQIQIMFKQLDEELTKPCNKCSCLFKCLLHPPESSEWSSQYPRIDDYEKIIMRKVYSECRARFKQGGWKRTDKTIDRFDLYKVCAMKPEIDAGLGIFGPYAEENIIKAMDSLWHWAMLPDVTGNQKQVVTGLCDICGTDIDAYEGSRCTECDHRINYLMNESEAFLKQVDCETEKMLKGK